MKAIAAVVALGAGERINVSGVCREAGISRKTFYKWHARYLAEGLDGLEERSRRPKRSPGQVTGPIEELIVRLRKALADDGLDHGATTIQWHLGHHPDMPRAGVCRRGRRSIGSWSAGVW